MKNLQLYRERKKELKLTNDDIAVKSGIPKRTVEDFFRGASQNPRIDTVEAIESALGLTEEEKNLGAQEIPLFPLNEDEQDLLELRNEIIRTKGEEFWKALEKILKILAEEKK